MRKTLVTFAATALIASSFAFSTTVEASSNSKQIPRIDSSKLVSHSDNKSISISSVNTYTVKEGDTLWGITSRLGISLKNIKKWNNMTSDTIQIGQKLKITSNSNNKEESQSSTSTVLAVNQENTNNTIISEAKKLIGKPYSFGSTGPNSFDCSGFIYYVLNKADYDISRTSSAEYYNQATQVEKPEIGDLVFFANTYKKGISHTGIYIGNNSFAHASSSGVKITKLNHSYWSKYFHSYGRLN